MSGTYGNLTSSGGNSYPQGFEADLDVEWAGAMAPNATICDVMQPFDPFFSNLFKL